MKSEHLAIGIGLVVVALVAFLVGRSSPREYQPPSPLSARPGGASPVAPRTTPRTGTSAPGRIGSRVAAAPSLTSKVPKPTTVPAASHIRGDRYDNPALGLVVSKPEGENWEMTDNRLNFRDPVRHPAKVLEIRRSPKDPNDKRFAIIELYVLDGASAPRARREVEKLERLGQRGRVGKFIVIKEDTTTIGGKDFGRRIVRWESPKAKAQILTLWRTTAGRLFVLMAMTNPEWFQGLSPEFDQTLASLRVP